MVLVEWELVGAERKRLAQVAETPPTTRTSEISKAGGRQATKAEGRRSREETKA